MVVAEAFRLPGAGCDADGDLKVAATETMRKEVPCPTCRRLTPWDGNSFRPFCSERCRLRDLGNWASERYRVPGPVVEDAPDEGAADDDDTEPH